MNKNTNTSERLKKISEFKGLTLNKFEQTIGASRGLIANSIKKGTDIQSKWLQITSEIFEDISSEWLLTGKGEMLKGETIAVAVPAELGKGIPMLPYHAQGGESAGDTLGTNLDQIDERYYISMLKGRADFLITIRGDSMSPAINGGDVIACQIVKDRDFMQWGKPHIIATSSQGIICKYLFESDDERFYICKSAEPEKFPDFKVPKEDVYDIARIVTKITHYQ